MSARGYGVAMYRDGIFVDNLIVSHLHITHAVNKQGWANITVRWPKVLDFYAIDNFVVITRFPGAIEQATPYEPNAPPLLLPGRVEYVGMITKRESGIDKDGNKYVYLGCPDLKYILTSMDVNAQAGAAEAKKTDYLDDMLKAVIGEQDGNLPSDFAIMGDQSLAPSTTLEFQMENVYDLAQDICSISAEEDTELFFDVAYLGPSSVQFRTMIDQPGVDTSSSILFADFIGNIATPRRTEDYTDEVTQVTAYGAGPAGNQQPATAEDTLRQKRSRWRYRSYSFNAGSKSDSTALMEEAKLVLNEGRPVIRFECELLDTNRNAVYGIHWHHGDKVKVGYEGREYTGIVRTTELDWKQEQVIVGNLPGTIGEEIFKARFEYQDLVGGGGGSVA